MSARLLVVDDEEVIRQVLSRMMVPKGFEVRCASSAEEALALLEKEAFDVILLDNVLPGMTGLRALGEILARSRAPVVMMTGHFDPEFQKDARLLGASAFVAKPLDFDVLEGEIRKLVPEKR